MSVKKMKNQWLIAILLLIVCLTLSTWLFFSGKKQPNTDEGEKAHAEGEAGHEESEKEEGSLNLTSKQLVEYGVKLEQVGRGEVEQSLSYPAKLVVNTDQQAHVSSTFSALSLIHI